MNTEWLENEEVVNRIKKLLSNSGAPLEVRTAQICQQFIAEQSTAYPDIYFSSERVIYYQDVQEYKLREVDRLIDIQSTIKVNNEYFFDINLHIPIECKYRNIDAFAFSTDLDIFDVMQISNPIMAWSAVGSRLIQSMQFVRPPILADEHISLVSFIEYDPDKSTYKTVYKDDDHIYKAGTALYDYIKSRIPPTPGYTEDQILTHMDILNPTQFLTIHPKSIYRSWFANIDQILPREPLDPYIKYNNLQADNIGNWHIIDIYFPIMCINSNLFSTSITDEGEIIQFFPKQFLLTGVMIQSWPTAAPHYLANVGKESLLTITNPDNLKDLLNGIMEWYLLISNFIANADENLKRVPLENAVFTRMLNTAETDETNQKHIWPGIL